MSFFYHDAARAPSGALQLRVPRLQPRRRHDGARRQLGGVGIASPGALEQGA